MTAPDLSPEAVERVVGALESWQLDDWQLPRAEAADLLRALSAENQRLEEKVLGLLAFKRGVEEALNSGDGSYRP